MTGKAQPRKSPTEILREHDREIRNLHNLRRQKTLPNSAISVGLATGGTGAGGGGTPPIPGPDGIFASNNTWTGLNNFQNAVSFSTTVNLGDSVADQINLIGRPRLYDSADSSHAGELEAFLTNSRTWIFPDSTGNIPLLETDNTWTNINTFTGDVVIGNSGSDDLFVNADATFTNDITAGSNNFDLFLCLAEAEFDERVDFLGDVLFSGPMSTVGDVQLGANNTDNVGFWGATPAPQPVITGSRGGNAALANLLTNLAAIGFLVDSTT